jgi:hypothetical protein
MPTKERKLREAERKAEEQRTATLLTPAKPPITNPFKAIANIPWGLVKVSSDGNHLYPDEKIGAGGNERRAEKKELDSEALQKEYEATWFKRGAAKRIAFEKGLSERTVQRYIMDSKKNTTSQGKP